MQPADTPRPPYYAVIFTSIRTPVAAGYADTSARMVELAAAQDGFLGVESARDDALGITVSYWASLEAIRAWKANAEHRIAQEKGRRDWYREYHVRIARVERAYDFTPIDTARSVRPGQDEPAPSQRASEGRASR